MEDSCILAKVSKTCLDMLCSEVDFEIYIRQCNLNYELDQLENITLHGKGDWKASAWILERKYPEKYGKKDIIKHQYEVKMKVFQKIVLDVINNTAPHLKTILVQKLREVDLEKTPLLENNTIVSDDYDDEEE